LKINAETTFVLNNSLAAVSAIISEGTVIASDGINCLLHFFDIGGDFQKVENTIRAYRRLRKNQDGDFFTAIGNCETPRVYFLDCNLNEFCLTELETENRCDCRNYDPDVLFDVSVTKIGNENFIIGAFSKAAFLFDMNGKRLQKLCEADRNEILTDFVSLGQDVFAMSTLKGTTRTVTVSNNGNVISSILTNSYNLRMLLPDENKELFALFGKNYIYNKIIKIYSQNVLTLPGTDRCV
jgi:hypothetical protein